MKRNKSMSIFNFKGQYSKDTDKVDLYNPKKNEAYGTACSMLIGRDGKPDSRYLGTGALVADMTSYGYVLASYTWRAYDGNIYTFFYCRSTASPAVCSLVYSVNESWALLQPAAAKWFDDQDVPTVLSVIPYMPTHTIPGFSEDHNGNLWISLGVSGHWRVVLKNGVPYFYLQRAPFSSFMLMGSGRSFTYPCDVPDMCWSAIGDAGRYIPQAGGAIGQPTDLWRGLPLSAFLSGVQGVKGSGFCGFWPSIYHLDRG